MPMARERPISRVRSYTDSTSVFTMPNSEMITLRASRPYTSVRIWFTRSTVVFLYSAVVWTRAVGVSARAASTAFCVCPMSLPGMALATTMNVCGLGNSAS